MTRVIRCDEERVYYCKKGQIPFKARVRLYAKVCFESGYKMGFFEWNSNKYCCPIRILRRCEVSDDAL